MKFFTGPGLHRAITPDVRILAGKMRAHAKVDNPYDTMHAETNRNRQQRPRLARPTQAGFVPSRPRGPAPLPPGMHGPPPNIGRGGSQRPSNAPFNPPFTRPEFTGNPPFRLPQPNNYIPQVQPPPPPSYPPPANQPTIGARSKLHSSHSGSNRPAVPQKLAREKPKPKIPQVRAIYG